MVDWLRGGKSVAKTARSSCLDHGRPEAEPGDSMREEGVTDHIFKFSGLTRLKPAPLWSSQTHPGVSWTDLAGFS